MPGSFWSSTFRVACGLGLGAGHLAHFENLLHFSMPNRAREA